MNDIITRIGKSKHVVVIAHMHPDADSLGGASAIYSYMLQLHKKVTFFCATKELDTKFSFLPWISTIRDKFPANADLAICIDCGDKARLDVVVNIDLINIDHHKSNNLFGQYNLVDIDAISTTQVVYDFFKMNNIKINIKMATALYAGLLDDSLNFLSEKTDEKTFLMAADLYQMNIDISTVSYFVSKRLSLAAFRLKGMMMKDVILLNDAKIALFLITQNILNKYGAKTQDCEAALLEGLFLPTVQVSVLLCENKDLDIKGSLRSKDTIDVDKIAKLFGGGGHLHSSGFLVKNKKLDDISSKILKIIIKTLTNKEEQ